MVLRFDCRKVNDLVTFRVGRDRKEHWIIAACNDGFLRVFSLKNLQLHKVVKGSGGSPTCIDVAKTNGCPKQSCDLDSHRDLVVVGYQDNSFVIYSILQGFKPLYRSNEHRNFVSQVKFDNFYMQKQMLIRDEELKGDVDSPSKQVIASKIGAEEQKSASGSKMINTSSKLMRRNSKQSLLELLRRNTTRSMAVTSGV